MKIENYEQYIKLVADEGMRLTNKDRTIFVEYLYLGKGDSPENYTEVGKEIWLPLAKDKSTKEHFEMIENSLKKVGDSQDYQDIAIDSTMIALAETFEMVLMLLEGNNSISLSSYKTKDINSNSTKGGVLNMVDFYVVAIQRGLKTIEDVPKMYRAQVQALLDSLE